MLLRKNIMIIKGLNQKIKKAILTIAVDYSKDNIALWYSGLFWFRRTDMRQNVRKYEI